MRILVVAERLPSPLGGGAARQYNLIRSLAGQHQFTVITHAFPDDTQFKENLEELVERLEIIQIQPPTAKNHSNFYWQRNAWQHALFDPLPKRGQSFQTPAIRKAIADRLASEAYDLIQVHQAYMLPVIPKTSIPLLMDMHDILSDYEMHVMQSRRKLTHRSQAWLEWKKMARLEKNIFQRCRISTLVSEADRDRFLQMYPSAKTAIVPNGVDLAYFSPQLETSSDNEDDDLVTFTGSMNYPPNADAVRWFFYQILPLIRPEHQSVRIKIVGWGPPDDILKLHAPPAIEVTGFVDDIRPHLAESAVIIVPLRFGSGTRLKILDAWAMGKAVVSTPLGAQGLSAVNGENILMAKTPDEFAAATRRLLADRDLRSKIGKAGRKTVEDHYSWTAISKQMLLAYDAVSMTPSA